MYLTHEVSGNAGGLIRWPAMLLLPLGFGLMFAAGPLGNHQAGLLPAGQVRDGHALRKAGAVIRLHRSFP
jgi:hypothetical protein